MDRDEICELLKMLLSVDTCNPPGSEAVLADKIIHRLSEYHPQFRKVYIGDNRCSLLFYLEGEKEECLAFAGHLDTVPAGKEEAWKYPPFLGKCEGEYVYGRGAADMKGGIAAMLLLYMSYRKEGKRPPCSLLFLFTADEETNGAGIAALSSLFLKEKECCPGKSIEKLKGMIFCEPTNNTLGISESGALWMKIRVQGVSCHASMSRLGLNALEEGIRFVQELKKEFELWNEGHPLLGKGECSLTGSISGNKINIIPDDAVFWLDIRTVPLCEKNIPISAHERIISAAEKIRQAKMKERKGLSITYEILTDRTALEMPLSSFFIKNLAAAMEKSGREVRYTGIRFFTDASVAVPALNKPFAICGPGEPGECHKTDEKIRPADIEEAVLLYKGFIEGLAPRFPAL